MLSHVKSPATSRKPEAHRRDVPNARVHVLDAGHFAWDTAASRRCRAGRAAACYGWAPGSRRRRGHARAGDGSGERDRPRDVRAARPGRAGGWPGGPGGGGGHRAGGPARRSRGRAGAWAPTRCPSTATWGRRMRRGAPWARRSSASAASTGSSAMPASTGPGRSSSTPVEDWDAALRGQHPGDVAAREGRASRAQRLARQHRGGRVDVGHHAHAGLGAYAPSKAAVIMLAKRARPGARPRRRPRQHGVAGNGAAPG